MLLFFFFAVSMSHSYMGHYNLVLADILHGRMRFLTPTLSISRANNQLFWTRNIKGRKYKTKSIKFSIFVRKIDFSNKSLVKRDYTFSRTKTQVKDELKYKNRLGTEFFQCHDTFFRILCQV